MEQEEQNDCKETFNQSTDGNNSYKRKSCELGANITKDELLSMVIKCVNFAALKHTKQRRKNIDETPYINHPIGVANILIEEGNVHDPVVILGALLHDTVEDTDTSFEEIEEKFGKDVRRVVEEVTDDKSLPSDKRKLLQIENAPKKSHQAKLIKLADKLYNLRDLMKETPVGWTSERSINYFTWAKAVISGCRGTNENLENLLDAVFEEHSKGKGDKISKFSTIKEK